MGKRSIYWMICLLAVLVSSCDRPGRADSAYGGVSVTELDSMRNSWRSFNVRGEYDSLIRCTLPVFRDAVSSNDTIPALYTGTFIAQAYLFKEDVDSVNYYLTGISGYLQECRDSEIKAIYNIVYGCYLLKSELDYSKALSAFYDALKWAEISGDINNQLVVLANISNIFYTRSDKHGIEYARKAYSIASDSRVADFPRCQAYIVMAQMLQLSEEYPQMLLLLDEVESITDSCGFNSLIPHINIIYANYYKDIESYRLADSAFRRAIEHSKLAEPSIASYIYMQYGDFCRDMGNTEGAIASYKSGLEISCANGNTEFRADLFQKLADVYAELGNDRESVAYVDALRNFKDSMSTYRKELDFNNLLLSYQKMEHDNEMQKKELDVLRANRKLVISVFVILLVFIISSSLTILYIRQKRMYRTLVQQHQNYMQRLHTESSAAGRRVEESVEEVPVPSEDVSESTPDKNDYEGEIFQRLEEMMKVSKIYHQKDLSLERIAEMLGTNRTYVSKAINMFSGMTFYSYLDMYRIREATEMISGPDDIPFKQMADDLGYNSVSVFYKAFRKETGCTPGCYREEVRKIHQGSHVENP